MFVGYLLFLLHSLDFLQLVHLLQSAAEILQVLHTVN